MAYRSRKTANGPANNKTTKPANNKTTKPPNNKTFVNI